MPTYLATNNVNDWSALTPAGTDSPAELDDALREIKLVMGNVTKNAATSKGFKRQAVWLESNTLAVPGLSGTANQWKRRSVSLSTDPTSLLAAGAYTSSIKPIAGYYRVTIWGTGYNCDDFCVRLAEATSNTMQPSGSVAIAGANTGIGFASGATATGVLTASFVLQADGVKSYCLDQISSATNGANGFGRAVPAGFTGVTAYPAGVLFDFLGATL